MVLLSPAYKPERPTPARVEAIASPPEAFMASRRVGAVCSLFIGVLSRNVGE